MIRPFVAMARGPDRQAVRRRRRSHPKPPVSSSSILNLQISRPGVKVFFDASVEVLLDGQSVGEGSVKQGLDITISTDNRYHEIRLRQTAWGFSRERRYAIAGLVPGKYWFKINYEFTLREAGNYTKNFELQSYQ